MDLSALREQTLDEWCGDAEEISTESLIFKAVSFFSNTLSNLQNEFLKFRLNGERPNVAIIKTQIKELAKVTTIFMRCFNVEPPNYDEIESFRETFGSNVDADGFLICMTMFRALADITIGYYEEDSNFDYETAMEPYVVEILAALSSLANRVGASLEDLI